MTKFTENLRDLINEFPDYDVKIMCSEYTHKGLTGTEECSEYATCYVEVRYKYGDKWYYDETHLKEDIADNVNHTSQKIEDFDEEVDRIFNECEHGLYICIDVA